jgi:signal transduction histidine kinase
LREPIMPTTRGIRHRLLTVILFGALTSALSLVALVRVLSVTTAQRLDRARDAVVDESEKLARVPLAMRREVLATPTNSLVGLRAGTLAGSGRDTPEKIDAPAGWRPLVDDGLRGSLSTGAPAVREREADGHITVVCVRPASDGGLVWAGVELLPPSWLLMWQVIVTLLAIATGLTVATAVYSVITVKRGAAALNASLVTLARDLYAPIPRPPVRELSDVADGIASLAQRLVQSRQAEERLARTLGQQERLAALGRVVAGVAHEVRNPLASIKLRLDLAVQSGEVPAVTQKALANASAEIERLDRLVADLLVVAGRAMGPRRPAALGALMQSRAEALAPWAASRGVSVRASGDAEASIDADSLARAIDNLLRNAVEASPVGGVVEARVVAVEGLAKVIVDDRGPGVPVERVAELFEPFFTTKPDGTGLGLALSRAIARAHGGDLTYARNGAVTRFELSLGGAQSSERAA